MYCVSPNEPALKEVLVGTLSPLCCAVAAAVVAVEVVIEAVVVVAVEVVVVVDVVNVVVVIVFVIGHAAKFHADVVGCW